MADDIPDLSNFFHPKIAPVVNASPLQRGTGDTLIRTAVTGGPEAAGDRRIYLASGLLGQLLEMARGSIMGRVRVDRAGVRVDLYEVPSTGHRYEVWTLIGADPKPEQLPAGLQALPSTK